MLGYGVRDQLDLQDAGLQHSKSLQKMEPFQTVAAACSGAPAGV